MRPWPRAACTRWGLRCTVSIRSVYHDVNIPGVYLFTRRTAGRLGGPERGPESDRYMGEGGVRMDKGRGGGVFSGGGGVTCSGESRGDHW